MTSSFVIKGDPVGKGRPRFTKKGHAFTPPKTREYESRAKLEYKIQKGKWFGSEPISMTVVATFAMPKGWSKKKREEMLDSPCTKNVDGDNILKCIQDALNGVAFEDDRQIYRCSCMKIWGIEGQTRVIISTYDEFEY